MKERLIVSDSCCNLINEYAEGYYLELVPFNLQLDDEHFVDDENLNVDEYREKMKNASVVRSSAPSPKLFLDKIKLAKEVFVVTMSNKISATYSNACLAANMLEDENIKVHVFDTKSAAGGETLVVYKIQECINNNMSFEEIVSCVEDYMSELQTFFVLEKLDNLIRNGRISKTKAMIATMLSIKPVLYAVDGEIEIFKKVRGLKKAYSELIDSISKFAVNSENKKLVITHCNCLERAKELKDKIRDKYKFKDVIILPAGGIATTYEDDGGIIINY